MLDIEYVVKVWHVVVYNLFLIVSATAVIVRMQMNLKQITILTDRMDSRLNNVEIAQHKADIKLPVMDEKLDRIRFDIAELKGVIRNQSKL